jgi:DNA-binding NarL/FixJ family response regulator
VRRGVDQRSGVPVSATKPVAAEAAVGRASDQSLVGNVLYIDQYALTRDCFASEFAMLLLPEFSLAAFGTLAEARRDAARFKRSCGVIYHALSLPIDDGRVSQDVALIRDVLSGIPIVLLSNLEAAGNVADAMRHGVAGYIPISLSLKIASQAIRLVLAGGTFVPASALSPTSGLQRNRSHVNSVPASAGLTSRQSEVLHQLWQGRQNKAIAHELGMCEGTVKVHIKHIMKRLGAHNRTQVVLMTRQMSGESENRGTKHISTTQLSPMTT